MLKSLTYLLFIFLSVIWLLSAVEIQKQSTTVITSLRHQNIQKWANAICAAPYIQTNYTDTQQQNVEELKWKPLWEKKKWRKTKQKRQLCVALYKEEFFKFYAYHWLHNPRVCSWDMCFAFNYTKVRLWMWICMLLFIEGNYKALCACEHFLSLQFHFQTRTLKLMQSTCIQMPDK